jgi:hypothetical protein
VKKQFSLSLFHAKLALALEKILPGDQAMPFDSLPNVETTKTDLEVLVSARDLIRRGWCQNVRQSGNKYCMIGALAKAANPTEILRPDEPCRDERVWRLVDKLAREITANYSLRADICYSQRGRAVVEFNDGSLRRKADVLSIFDKLIARLS